MTEMPHLPMPLDPSTARAAVSRAALALAERTGTAPDPALADEARALGDALVAGVGSVAVRDPALAAAALAAAFAELCSIHPATAPSGGRPRAPTRPTHYASLAHMDLSGLVAGLDQALRPSPYRGLVATRVVCADMADLRALRDTGLDAHTVFSASRAAMPEATALLIAIGVAGMGRAALGHALDAHPWTRTIVLVQAPEAATA